MEDTSRMRFGVLLSPFHRLGQHPTLCLHKDLELVDRLEQWDYEEAWFGEHHSGGWSIIGAPDLVIATAAQRTSRIKLGTGVLALPFQHPFIVAERMVLLDHLTRGRAILGVGPGGRDAETLGIEQLELRRRQEQSLEAILALLAYEDVVTRQTDWFTLNNAMLQLPTYTAPRFEIAVTQVSSPAGPRLAGKYGVTLMSLNATTLKGFEALRTAWSIAEDQAANHGKTVTRRDWRVVGLMHIAETEKQAREDVRYGLQEWTRYLLTAGTVAIDKRIVELGTVEEQIEALNREGIALIGTPDDAERSIRRLQEQSGGFGVFLLGSHSWVNREASLRHYELFAREVMPRFQGLLRPLERSWDWMETNHERLQADLLAGKEKAAQEFAEEVGGG